MKDNKLNNVRDVCKIKFLLKLVEINSCMSMHIKNINGFLQRFSSRKMKYYNNYKKRILRKILKI